MIKDAKYAHTNLIARDWHALAWFYQTVFGCMPIPPERNFTGPDLEAATGIPGAQLRGIHLRLPGLGAGELSLEIFEYGPAVAGVMSTVNRLGFGHIAFSVTSVYEAREQVLMHGGASVGEIVSLTTATGTIVTWCYVSDPEGNVIELQSWS